MLLRILATWLLVVAIHEAGHVIAGRLAGMRYWWLQVGPVLIARNRSGTRIRLQRFSLAWGGICASFQPGLDIDRAISVYRWVCAGGPLLNLLSGVAASMVIGPLHPFSTFSIVIGIATLLPFGTNVDGARLRVLLGGGAAARECAALLGVASAISLEMDGQAVRPLLAVLSAAENPRYRELAGRAEQHLSSA